MPRRWLNHVHNDALKEGAVWERLSRPQHESRVKIIKVTDAALGRRYLVQGLESGRQWLISHPTLLNTYKPQTEG